MAVQSHAKAQTFSGGAFFKVQAPFKKEADLSRKGNSARYEGGSRECGGLQLLRLVGGDGPGNAARLGSPAPLRCLRCQPLRSGFVARICKPKKISERTDRSSNACGNKCQEDSGQLLQAIFVHKMMSRGVLFFCRTVACDGRLCPLLRLRNTAGIMIICVKTQPNKVV